jgi:hypothetical protein
VFKARLAFANERSSRLSTAAYTAFVQSRERGFVGGMRSSRAFASTLPAPAITRACLEVLGYMAHDRVCTLVEGANKATHGGKLTVLDPVAHLSEAHKASEKERGSVPPLPSLPLTAYVIALISAPLVPQEVEKKVETLHAQGAVMAASEAWKAAWAQESAQVQAENEDAKRRAEAWAAQRGRDVQGDEAFVAAMHATASAAPPLQEGVSQGDAATAAAAGGAGPRRLKSLKR